MERFATEVPPNGFYRLRRGQVLRNVVRDVFDADPGLCGLPEGYRELVRIALRGADQEIPCATPPSAPS